MKQWMVMVMVYFATNALGREIGNFSVEVGASEASKSVDGPRQGSVDIGNGWSCIAKTIVNQIQTLKDYKGDAKVFQPYAIRTLDHSLLSSPKLQTSFEQDLNGTQSTEIRFGEYCHECHVTFWVTYNSKGRPINNYRKDCNYAQLIWACPLGEAAPEHETKTVPCRVIETASSATPRKALRFLEKAPMSAKFTLKSKQEKLTADLCNGSTENRSVIRLGQGVGGHKGEDQFHFFVQVDDQKPIEIVSASGVLYDDIAVCPKSGKVRVKVWAIEKDLLFNDKYTPVVAQGIELTVGAGEKKIALKRRSYTGMTPTLSEVTAQLVPAPKGKKGIFAQAEAPLEPHSRGASTH